MSHPVTLAQRGQDADDAAEAAQDIDDRGAGAQRPALRARHIGKSAHHLRDLVEGTAMLVRAGEKAFQCAIDQPGVDRLQAFVAKLPFVHGAGREVLQEHVCVFDEFEKQLAPLRGFEIENHAALVGVEHGEGQR